MGSSGTAVLANELQRMIEILRVSRDDLVADVEASDQRATQLLAQLRAIGGEAAPAHEEHFALGELSIDFAGHAVRLGREPVHLTHREFALLSLLVQQRGRVCRREQIARRVWGDRCPASTRTIDIHVYRLRTKLAAYAHVIETVRGVGYIFRLPSDARLED